MATGSGKALIAVHIAEEVDCGRLECTWEV
ncbi:hypothetical protein M877_28260 [Streptomyces niveus NCIMB 11891]|nr:hypothetical protein M877_28260 [Streptomyces niveus NCIMB 11891]